MKKILILMFLLIPINVFSLSASSVTVMDMDTNRVLYSYNQNDKRLIASITKIMTSLVTINNYDIDKVIKIDESVLKSYGSGIYVEVGEEISVKDLLYGLMLRSGNDAAMQLETTIGGSKEGFAKLMNETASNIGMKNTNFINGSGLEENDGSGNMSTSYDMAILMSEAMKNRKFRNIVGTKKYTVKTNLKTYIWHNKNKLLNTYKYTTGGKTGFTEKARRTLVTTASKDNMNLVIVTLNDPNDFLDHKNLYEEYFDKYKSYKVLDKKREKFENKSYYIKNDRYLTLTEEEYKNIDKEILFYDANVSDLVGELKVKLDNEVVIKEYIYEKVVKKNSVKKLSLWDKFKKIFNVFRV